MASVIEIIKQIKDGKSEIEFMPTGFRRIDEFLDGGLMRKELVILGGYTGLGKSFFAANILFNIAKNGFKTAYFSLEISNRMIVSRLVGSIADIKPTRLIAGFLNPDENDRRIEAETGVEMYSEFMEFYDDLYEYEKIKNKIIEGGFEFVVIDFIQNVFGLGNDEYTRLSSLALKFQKLAKDTNSCILLVSQLSNDAAKKGYVEYKGSGSLQTVCDLGFFLTREEATATTLSNDVALKLLKNRRGISGVEFGFSFKHPGGEINEKEQDFYSKN